MIFFYKSCIFPWLLFMWFYGKILIVDDAETLVLLLSEILINRGFTVDLALSKKLIHILLSSAPDLILLDVRLSGDDARKMCRDLKANLSCRSIPVILLSGSYERLESFADNNAYDIIEKPLEMYEIVEKITGILKPGSR